MIASRRTWAALLTVLALGAGGLAPANASAASLNKGVYDCMSYNYYSGFLDYKGSVKLMSGGRYQHAWGRKGRKFTKPTSGTYRIRGKKVKFRGGAMEDTPGQIAKRTQFDVLVDGQKSGVSCYFVKNP